MNADLETFEKESIFFKWQKSNEWNEHTQYQKGYWNDELHKTFLENIFAYCKTKNINLQIMCAPHDIVFSNDLKHQFYVGVKEYKPNIDISSSLEIQGKDLADRLIFNLDTRNIDILALYAISSDLKIKFATVNLKVGQI